MKEGEVISQRTCMHNPYRETTVWRWPEEDGAGVVEVGEGEDEDICNNINNKNIKIQDLEYIIYVDIKNCIILFKQFCKPPVLLTVYHDPLSMAGNGNMHHHF